MKPDATHDTRCSTLGIHGAAFPTPDSSFRTPDSEADPWAALRRFTAARIALGRTGGSPRTATLLDFRLCHAQARDAVHAPFDAPRLCDELSAHLHDAGLASLFPSPPCRLLTTAVSDRATFLARPDLGRRLSDASREEVRANASAWGRRDLALLVSDGLSAQAALRHAAATLVPLAARLAASGWSFFPLFVVPFARVKLQDELGELLNARLTLMLLGERPGLDSPDSLGAYFTHTPRAACRDADRNCVSNIRPAGLQPADAAAKLADLLTRSVQLGTSGVTLKDTGAPSALLDTDTTRSP